MRDVDILHFELEKWCAYPSNNLEVNSKLLEGGVATFFMSKLSKTKGINTYFLKEMECYQP